MASSSVLHNFGRCDESLRVRRPNGTYAKRTPNGRWYL